jgi:hypothetical protein
MLRKITLITFVLVLSLTVAVPVLAGGGRPGSDKVVYVTSQGLYYDTIVGPVLPQKGPFQKLEMAGPTGLQTEFGPGDPGYVGGRWWLDANGNGEQDAEDAYFSCPLLGPGRENP